MHRTEGADNIGNLFANGPPGTWVEEDWLNAVQEELCDVVEEAGYAVKTAATETRDQLVQSIAKLIDITKYGVDVGAVDAYVITRSPVPPALYDGMLIAFKANTANTGASTLNDSGLGVKAIKKDKDQNTATGDIKAGQIITVRYDITNDWYQIQNIIVVDDTAYAVGWNGDTTRAPSKNAVYDVLTRTLLTAQGDIVYASAANVLARLPKGAVGQVLTADGAANPSWATVTLVSDAAYGAAWNGDTTHAASKNAIYDQIQTIPNMFRGLEIRAPFEYKDNDEIYMYSAVYHLRGASEQMVYWDTRLTYLVTSLAVSDWSYIYIDDSAVIAAGTNLLTASEFIDSTTEPAWSNSKHGWYNGNDRCIFAVLTDAGSNILKFFHSDDFVCYDTEITDVNGVDYDLVWTDATMTIPKFSTCAEVIIVITAAAGAVNCYWRTNGGAGTHRCSRDIAGEVSQIQAFVVVTDGDQKIELVHDLNDASVSSCYTQGWYFPTGL